MNRKAESISSMISVQLSKARADFAAADSLARSLEAVTDNEFASMEIDEWGAHRDLAAKVRDQYHEFRRAIGELPPISMESLKKSKALEGVGPRQAEEKPPAARRAARPPGTRKQAIQVHGKGSPDAALPRQAKEKTS